MAKKSTIKVETMNNKKQEKIATKREIKKDSFFEKVWGWIKNFLSSKINLIISIIVLVIIIGLILFFMLGKKDERFALNELYDYFPEDVRKLYSNLVSVGCNGDLHFNIEVGKGKVDIEKLDRRNLLDYMFSYLDKNDFLNDKIDDSVFKNAERDLFDGNLDLLDDIKDYNYGEYTYNLSMGKVTRKKNQCEVMEKQPVLHLYGYSGTKELSIDVNVAYLKDGILYDYNDQKLGEYDGDVTKLPKLTSDVSYYRLNYVNKNGKLKLTSIEWKNKS